jgi:hypothetical protein
LKEARLPKIIHIVVSMPPKASAKVVPNVKSIAQKRKAQEEKLAEAASPSKRVKKTEGGKEKAGVVSSPSKPITPAKSVINLHDAVIKVEPETYINPTARKFFHEAEVLSLLLGPWI